MPDGTEFQVCGGMTDNAGLANSVHVIAAEDSSGVLDDYGNSWLDQVARIRWR